MDPYVSLRSLRGLEFRFWGLGFRIQGVGLRTRAGSIQGKPRV